MRKALRFIPTTAIRRVVAFSLAALTICPAHRGSAGEPRPALAHFGVSTNRPEAQREFDVGLTLLYAFNPEEATYHFQQAARTDAGLAMAYWGIGLAAGPNVNTSYDLQRAAIGRAAVAQARALDARDAPVERALIDALAVRYTATDAAAVPQAQADYAAAMRAAAGRFSNDATVQTLYADSLMDLNPLDYWQPGGAPGGNTREIVDVLSRVLARDPAAIGANHDMIHVYEYSPTPQAALPSARRLLHMTFEPGAEHLAHMPAHIFMRTGDYDDAIAASLAAAAMFRRYVGQEHSDVHNPYYHHDLQVLDYAYMMSGQWPKARAVAGEIADQVADNGAAVETYVRFHRWRELLALPPPAQPGFRWRFAQAMAQAGMGDRDGARATIAWIESLHDTDPRTAIAHALLVAAVAAGEHQAGPAIDALRSAVKLEDGLRVKEPPAWFYPIRETLGAQLALARRPADAQRVFEDDLQRNPRNPRSLFGLATVLAATDRGRAASVRAQFERAWRHADAPLRLDDL